MSSSLGLLDSVGASTAILSLTAPGACILQGQPSRNLARAVNEELNSMRSSHPARYGYFATLPSLYDTEGVLAEIAYALDVLHADGIGLFTRYGDTPDESAYLGSAAFKPVWQMLEERKAVVFVHPTHPMDTKLVNGKLAQPVADYTHETTRTALSLVTTGTMAKIPNVKVILSHAGGTLPYIVDRMTALLPFMPETEGLPNLTADQIARDIRSFYYDLALCSKTCLDTLLKNFPEDHILYGSDYPYAYSEGIIRLAKEVDGYEIGDKTRETIYRGNALKMFPRFR